MLSNFLTWLTACVQRPGQMMMQQMPMGSRQQQMPMYQPQAQGMNRQQQMVPVQQQQMVPVQQQQKQSQAAAAGADAAEQYWALQQRMRQAYLPGLLDLQRMQASSQQGSQAVSNTPRPS